MTCVQNLKTNDLLIIRDLKIILLCFAGFLRYDEISSILCNNVQIYDEYLILFIEKAKTDQHRNGNEVHIVTKGILPIKIQEPILFKKTNDQLILPH